MMKAAAATAKVDKREEDITLLLCVYVWIHMNRNRENEKCDSGVEEK